MSTTYIDPPPDEATEKTWAGDLLARISGMILDWKETRIAYNTFVAERGAFGIPVIGADWTQAQDDQYNLINYVVYTIAEYASEVDEGVRKVAYDTFGDQVVMLGDAGDIQLSAKDGVLSVKIGDKSASIDPSGFVGVAWPVVVIVVAGVAAHIVLVIQISTVIRDYIKKLIQKDTYEHEEKIASDIIAKGGDPATAHKIATQATNDQLSALAAKARADAEADEKGGMGQLASTIKTVAWVALGVAIIGGAIYFGAPLLQRAMSGSRGGGNMRMLAQQNPSKPSPVPGYAYYLDSDRPWNKAPIDDWEHTTLDASDTGFTFVGTRRIDGSLCNVWSRGGTYYAQLEHMTRGEKNPTRGQSRERYTSIGSYPLYYYNKKHEIFCPDCALDKYEAEVNWENPDLECTRCGERIESAYAEDESKNPSGPGYVYRMTYGVVTEESAQDGDYADQGWEIEGSETFQSLRDLLRDVPGHSWLEWSSYPPSPGSWITSEGEQDMHSGDSTNYDLFIEHADGSELSKREMAYVHKQLGLHGKM